MAKKCAITGKTPLTGNNVSHSNVKTKRRQNPNLQKKRLMNPITGRLETIMVTARGLRTLAKWQKEGKKYDLK
ncbi:50S ribosomal protein L28 [Patescibacteria group bacterium]|nr:50S ribosomal protein L28 [Patescibacteria group bacterium]MBU4452664.1 50S ribosomal protein L28 [Patescibacteria group bacterium]MCG2687961.1 50S ribosomal protein L28 [Candidatus Parcubacteria bacterium]